MPGEEWSPDRIVGDRLPIDERGHQQNDADDRCLADASGTHHPHVDAHDQRNRNGRGDSEEAPRAVGERLHHDQAQHRQDYDHDGEDADHGDRARRGTQFHLDHFAERFSVAAHGSEQHDEILHCAGKHHADQNPQRAGEEAHLRRQDRTDERAGAGDRGEMMTVKHVLVGRHVIHAVVMALGRRHAGVVEPEHLVRDELAVEPVGDEVDAERGGHQPHCAYVFAATQGERGKGKCADDSDQRPQGNGHELVHDSPPLMPARWGRCSLQGVRTPRGHDRRS